MVEGIPAVGGSSPNSVVTDGKRVYVSNNNSDSIAVVDVATNQLIAQVPLTIPIPQLGKLRGIMPFGLALSPDGRTLYAAESGINAVAVIDTQRLRAVGHIPVGWFPSKLAVSPDGGKLYVANAKGYGSGPNGGPNFTPGPEGTYVGLIQKGTISLIDLPDFSSGSGLGKLRTWTDQVLRNNGFVPRARFEPDERESACSIKHVIFITKENRTYDEVLGDLGMMSNRAVNGIASMARYGQQVTPNHHALARRFAHSDNFYMDSDVSADGHRWLVGVAPNEFVETSWSASYVADNDLAVGRVVDLVSNSKYWASTAIFVTEDDSQDGVDHVDAHRSLLLVIGPWAKRGYVSGQHTSIPSIIKTINLFSGAPALNLYDATATDLLDMFTDKPDFTPYTALPTGPTIFDPSKVKRGNFTAADLEGGEEIDNAEIIAARQREEQAEQAPSVSPYGGRRGFLHDDPGDRDDR